MEVWACPSKVFAIWIWYNKYFLKTNRFQILGVNMVFTLVFLYFINPQSTTKIWLLTYRFLRSKIWQFLFYTCIQVIFQVSKYKPWYLYLSLKSCFVVLFSFQTKHTQILSCDLEVKMVYDGKRQSCSNMHKSFIHFDLKHLHLPHPKSRLTVQLSTTEKLVER